MDKIKPLYTATATATGGRNGHTETSDGVVKADLSLPKEMGGPGRPGAATPEHLFAAGQARSHTRESYLKPTAQTAIWRPAQAAATSSGRVRSHGLKATPDRSCLGAVRCATTTSSPRAVSNAATSRPTAP